jgi:AraC-like DNA-binding protein
MRPRAGRRPTSLVLTPRLSSTPRSPPRISIWSSTSTITTCMISPPGTWTACYREAGGPLPCKYAKLRRPCSAPRPGAALRRPRRCRCTPAPGNAGCEPGARLLGEIKDEARRDLDERYLSHPDVPLTQVTSLLDYSEQSAFGRSCRRRDHPTPREFRNRLPSRAPVSPPG